MSKYSNNCPADLYDDEDVDDYDDYPRLNDERSQTSLFDEQQKQISGVLTGIKIIPQIGVAAGLQKTDFDINLDVNAQKWFDHIHQYWKQCKLTTYGGSQFRFSGCLTFQLKSRQCCRMLCNSSTAVVRIHSSMG